MTTAAGPPSGDAVTVAVEWPSTANAGARVANIYAYQWDQDRTGLYLLVGHVGIPVWVGPGDRERWEEANPDNRIEVESLGAFYMTDKVARDLCKGLANHLGMAVVEGAPGAAP
jgi:hypothetical protein